MFFVMNNLYEELTLKFDWLFVYKAQCF